MEESRQSCDKVKERPKPRSKEIDDNVRIKGIRGKRRVDTKVVRGEVKVIFLGMAS